jgi:hypothetical protein
LGITADYDLGGRGTLRLLDASPGDLAAVSRQLRLTPAATEEEPLLRIRFVDRLPRSRPLRLLGSDAAFGDDGFFVLHRGTRTRLPLDRLGEPCEVVCERPVAEVPLLVPMLNLGAIARGTLPLHASAFEVGGRGVAVTAWADGSKTGVLLAGIAAGGRYVGDDWAHVGRDGQLSAPPVPCVLRAHYLRELAGWEHRVAPGERSRLRKVELAQRVLRGVKPLLRRASKGATDRMDRALTNRARVVVEPEEFFGTPVRESVMLNTLIWSASHTVPEAVIRPADPSEIAGRVAAALLYELQELRGWYLKFRFAFPAIRNPLVESLDTLVDELAVRALGNAAVYELRHPYPARIQDLRAAIEPILTEAPSSAEVPA